MRGHADEQAGLHHADGLTDRLVQARPDRRSGRSRNRGSDCRRRCGTAAGRVAACSTGSVPSCARRSAVVSQPNGTTSTGSRCGSAQPIDQLPAHRRRSPADRDAAATIFSRSSAPPRPLIRLSEPSSISSAPSIVMSSRRCSAKLVSGMPPARAWAPLRSEVGMREDAQTLAHPADQRLDGEPGGRAGAEADHHAVLDQRGRGFGRRALLGVACSLAVHQPRTFSCRVSWVTLSDQ